MIHKKLNILSRQVDPPYKMVLIDKDHQLPWTTTHISDIRKMYRYVWRGQRCILLYNDKSYCTKNGIPHWDFVLYHRSYLDKTVYMYDFRDVLYQKLIFRRWHLPYKGLTHPWDFCLVGDTQPIPSWKKACEIISIDFTDDTRYRIYLPYRGEVFAENDMIELSDRLCGACIYNPIYTHIF